MSEAFDIFILVYTFYKYPSSCVHSERGMFNLLLFFMRALVTGGTGFIGSNLVLRLIEQGFDVIITGHDAEQSLPEFRGKYLQSSFIGLDFEAIGQVDVVFHQSAINNTTFFDSKEMMRANVESSQRLFEYAVAHGCKRIVYASSTAVYGNVAPPYRENRPLQPLNPYAESKKALDEWAMQFARLHPEVIIVGLRYCNVYGPRENHKGKRASMIYQLTQQMKSDNPRLFKYGEQKRDYIYVADVVEANMCVLNTRESCIVNCGSGTATSFNDVVGILNKVLGLDRKPEYIENPHPKEYQNFTQCDMTLAREKLGFVPEYDIERGIMGYFKSGYL